MSDELEKTTTTIATKRQEGFRHWQEFLTRRSIQCQLGDQGEAVGGKVGRPKGGSLSWMDAMTWRKSLNKLAEDGENLWPHVTALIKTLEVFPVVFPDKPASVPRE